MNHTSGTFPGAFPAASESVAGPDMDLYYEDGTRVTPSNAGMDEDSDMRDGAPEVTAGDDQLSSLEIEAMEMDFVEDSIVPSVMDTDRDVLPKPLPQPPPLPPSVPPLPPPSLPSLPPQPSSSTHRGTLIARGRDNAHPYLPPSRSLGPSLYPNPKKRSAPHDFTNARTRALPHRPTSQSSFPEPTNPPSDHSSPTPSPQPPRQSSPPPSPRPLRQPSPRLDSLPLPIPQAQPPHSSSSHTPASQPQGGSGAHSQVQDYTSELQTALGQPLPPSGPEANVNDGAPSQVVQSHGPELQTALGQLLTPSGSGSNSIANENDDAQPPSGFGPNPNESDDAPPQVVQPPSGSGPNPNENDDAPPQVVQSHYPDLSQWNAEQYQHTTHAQHVDISQSNAQDLDTYQHTTYTHHLGTSQLTTPTHPDTSHLDISQSNTQHFDAYQHTAYTPTYTQHPDTSQFTAPAHPDASQLNAQYLSSYQDTAPTHPDASQLNAQYLGSYQDNAPYPTIYQQYQYHDGSHPSAVDYPHVSQPQYPHDLQPSVLPPSIIQANNPYSSSSQFTNQSFAADYPQYPHDSQPSVPAHAIIQNDPYSNPSQPTYQHFAGNYPHVSQPSVHNPNVIETSNLHSGQSQSTHQNFAPSTNVYPSSAHAPHTYQYDIHYPTLSQPRAQYPDSYPDYQMMVGIQSQSPSLMDVQHIHPPQHSASSVSAHQADAAQYNPVAQICQLGTQEDASSVSGFVPFQPHPPAATFEQNHGSGMHQPPMSHAAPTVHVPRSDPPISALAPSSIHRQGETPTPTPRSSSSQVPQAQGVGPAPPRVVSRIRPPPGSLSASQPSTSQALPRGPSTAHPPVNQALRKRRKVNQTVARSSSSLSISGTVPSLSRAASALSVVTEVAENGDDGVHGMQGAGGPIPLTWKDLPQAPPMRRLPLPPNGHLPPPPPGQGRDGYPPPPSGQGRSGDPSWDEAAERARQGHADVSHHLNMNILNEVRGIGTSMHQLRADIPQMIDAQVRKYIVPTNAPGPSQNAGGGSGRRGGGQDGGQKTFKTSKDPQNKKWERPEGCKDGDWTEFKTTSREHFRKMLGWKAKDKTKHQINLLPPPLTENQLNALQYDENGECWTKTNWRIDFSQPWTFPPNASAARVFVASFIESALAGTYLIPNSLLKPGLVEGRFHGYFTHLKNTITKSNTDQEPASNDRPAQNARRKTLCNRRVKACLSRPGTQRHADLLQSLEPAHMSDDEFDTDAPSRQFKIINVAWRSQEFTLMLRRLDYIYTQNLLFPSSPHLMAPFRSQFKNTPGNVPRQRVPTNKWVDGSAPYNLPYNCYDPHWLSTLTPTAFQNLRVQNLLYAFDIPEEELQPLRRYYNGLT